jgi:uncharacterized protein (TIGR00266 family)
MSTLSYEIIGDDLQAVIIKLSGGQSVLAEPGMMMYMDGGVEIETKLDDKPNSGFVDKLFAAGKRVLTGESLFVTVFQNTTSETKEVAFAGPYPGKLMPIDLKAFGGEILCQRDSFVAATRGTEITMAFTKRLGAGFFGGEGFILQKIVGDGLAFLHAGGTVHKIELKPGQVLKVDTGCIVGFSPSVDYDIQMMKGFKNILFGGEGLFLAILKGPGTVYLQSLPFSRLADRIIAASSKMGSGGVGEGGPLSGGSGGMLGGLGNLIGGE